MVLCFISISFLVLVAQNWFKSHYAMEAADKKDLYIKIQTLKFHNEILYFENSVIEMCLISNTNLFEISKLSLLLKQINSNLQLFFQLNIQNTNAMKNVMKIILYEKKRIIACHKVQKRDFVKSLNILKFDLDLIFQKFRELNEMKKIYNTCINNYKQFTADDWIMYVQKWCKYLDKRIQRKCTYESILNNRLENINKILMKTSEITHLPKQKDFEKLNIEVTKNHQMHLDYQCSIKNLKKSLISIDGKILQCRKFIMYKISNIDDMNAQIKVINEKLKNLCIEKILVEKEIHQILIKIKTLENLSESNGNPTIIDYIKRKRAIFS